MSLILENGNLISVDNIDNLLNLEQRNKNKYDMQDAVYNESKSNSDNNDDNNNNYNDNSKHDNKNYNSDNDNDGNGNGNNNSKYDANNYDVNYKSECLGLVIIRIKSSQNLNSVESNMFCHYNDKKLEFA